MNDKPNSPPIITPLKATEKKMKTWPWLLLQFLPAVGITIFVLLAQGRQYSSRSPFSQQMKTICAAALMYSYVLCFFFYRRRGKSILMSLLVSIPTVLVVLVANVILILGIVFVGCLVAIGSHAK